MGKKISKLYQILLVSTLTLFICVASPGLAFANNQAPDCKAKYEKLSKQHDKVLAEYKHDTPDYYREMHQIENDIFAAFQACPKNPLLFTIMGEVQISLNNLQLANLYAQKAYGWNPGIWQTQHLLGTALSMQGYYDNGLKHLEKAADLAENKPRLVFNLCSTYLAAKNYDKTVQACTELLKRDDHQLHGPAFQIRGEAYQALNMETKAQQDFEKARGLGFQRASK